MNRSLETRYSSSGTQEYHLHDGLHHQEEHPNENVMLKHCSSSAERALACVKADVVLRTILLPLTTTKMAYLATAVRPALFCL